MQQLIARRQGGNWVIDSIAISALLASAWVLYRPPPASPFDILDYSEVLPQLQNSSGFLGSISALLRYFATQGRTNIGTYLYIAFDWSLFGLHSEGWQLGVWVVMAILVVLVFVVGRSWRWSPIASFLASGLLVVGSPAAESWVRLAGEPLACIAFVVAVAHAGRSREHSLSYSQVLWLGVLCLALTLIKEVLVVLIPVVLFARVVGASRSGRPQDVQSHMVMVVLFAAVLCIRLLWAAKVIVEAPTTAYSSLYTLDRLPSAPVSSILLTILLPVRAVVEPPWLRILVPANLFYALALLVAWVGIGIHEPRKLTKYVTSYVAMCGIGALAYAPWPRFESFYALPFVLPSVAMLGHSLSRVRQLSARCSLLAYSFASAAVTLAALGAGRAASVTWARRLVENAVVQEVATQSAAVAVVRKSPPSQAWQGTGPTMARYAVALHWEWRPKEVSDFACNDSRLRALAESHVVIVYVHECQEWKWPVARSFVERFTYRDWFARSQPDSIRIDVASPLSRPTAH